MTTARYTQEVLAELAAEGHEITPDLAALAAETVASSCAAYRADPDVRDRFSRELAGELDGARVANLNRADQRLVSQLCQTRHMFHTRGHVYRSAR